MSDVDLEYLCRVIGNLSGIPIRLYRDGQPDFLYSTVSMPKDPVNVHLEEILAVDRHVGYYVTPLFDYYGIVNSSYGKLVLGPTRQIAAEDRKLRELAFEADVDAAETGDFIAAMKSIIAMPLESVMQMLCAVNYVVNGERLELQDVAIFDSMQRELSSAALERTEAEPLKQPHNTLDLEERLMSIVRRGDSAALDEWVGKAPAIRGGTLAAEHIRQMKNTFIVTVTLASRAAIRGGMDAEDALSLSDSYIRKCELFGNVEQITNLQYHMIRDYTERVERLRVGDKPSKLALEVSNYVQHHISEPITAEELAARLFISRTYLSRAFKQETGATLTDFILTAKTDEAKRLLRFSDKPLSAISAYLGFSSQSHFTRVFKKYSGATPNEYREKHSR